MLCVDNKAALAALIKGSSSSELGATFVNLFWSMAARCPVIWRFEYVNTKANAADPPSRVCGAPMGLACGRASGTARILENFLFMKRSPPRIDSLIKLKRYNL